LSFKWLVQWAWMFLVSVSVHVFSQPLPSSIWVQHNKSPSWLVLRMTNPMSMDVFGVC
jgi:hypothetical protein